MSTETGTSGGTAKTPAGRPRTIAAREIKRRGIGAVDELIKQGAVHVIREDEPRYVVLSEDMYEELVDGYQEAYLARVRSALQDVKQGRVRRFESTADLMRAIDTREDSADASPRAAKRAPRKTPSRASSR